MDVVAAHPDEFEISAMSSHTDEDGLVDLARGHDNARLCLSGRRSTSSRVAFSGREELLFMIATTTADIVVNGIAGSAGLEPSLTALSSGKNLALANKESIVMAGRLVLATAMSNGTCVLPLDSEHAAVSRLLERMDPGDVEEIILTASGGGLRNRPVGELDRVKLEDAVAHPTWNMGRKISVDSSTMANKGLEVIEAVRLFGVPAERVHVVIHPQSIVHSLVRTKDGALYAQLSAPDMRAPIFNALAWPERRTCPYGILDLAGISLDFERPDPVRFPLLDAAYGALRAGEGACIAYNASNEIAVEAFMTGILGYTGIYRVVAGTLESSWPMLVDGLDDIIEIDRAARGAAVTTMEGIQRC